MITILVGPDKRSFGIHKALLVDASDYFAKATTGDWSEARTKVHTFEDVNVQVFEVFVRWLYTATIELIDAGDVDQILVLAWVLGDRLQARHFKNVVINALCEDWRAYRLYPVTLNAAAMAYELSPENSKIRLLACHKFSNHTDNKWEDNDVDGLEALPLPAELVLDLWKSTSTIVSKVRSKDIDSTVFQKELSFDVCAQYHEHTPEEAVCTKSDMSASFKLVHSKNTKINGKHPFAVFKHEPPVVAPVRRPA